MADKARTGDGRWRPHDVEVHLIPKAKPAIRKTPKITEPFPVTKRKMTHAQFRSQQQTGDETRLSLTRDDLDAPPDEQDMVDDDDGTVAKVPLPAEEKRMTKDQHEPPKPATRDDLLDPYAPGSAPDPIEEAIDLSRDPSSDPNYDFAAHGWTWSEADQAMIPPPNL